MSVEKIELTSQSWHWVSAADDSRDAQPACIKVNEYTGELMVKTKVMSGKGYRQVVIQVPHDKLLDLVALIGQSIERTPEPKKVKR